ncbi:MAG TPA: peroxidase, partial [Thermoanaerobaculia bacterium]|nr:peroxidase [Thermoanaerobaculia bacterium]
RKANPRGEVPHMDPESQTHARIVRRGIPYGTRKRHPSEFQSLDDLPSEGVGLLFMCFQRMIETQFRFIHQNWVNFAAFRELGTGIDPLIGQGTATAQRWPKEYGSAEPHCEAAFGGFVKMKGGEYFFTPSIPFLRKLGP